MEDVKEAITKKKNAEKQSETLAQQLDKNNALKKTLMTQVKTLMQEIEDAQNGKVRLAAQLESSALREKIAKQTAGYGQNHDSLKSLAQAADRAEAKAEAWEEIATGNSESTLEQKYATETAVSDEDISKYIGNYAPKQEEASK